MADKKLVKHITSKGNVLVLLNLQHMRLILKNWQKLHYKVP